MDLMDVLDVSGVKWGAVAQFAALAFAVYLVFEQAYFRLVCRDLAAPKSVVPLIGGIVEMVKDPYGFWEKQRALERNGVSKFMLLGKLVLFSTDTDVSRRILMHNGPDALLMAVHPSGKWILGPKNLAFMHGPEHKALRKSFLSLFTPKALSIYASTQDAVIKRHLEKWAADPECTAGFAEMRDRIRDMNQETSQMVFVGPYLQPEERDAFGDDYKNMTDGFLSFPLPLPGTAVWRGMQSRKKIITLLTRCAAESKKVMKSGKQPACLLDFWVEHLQGEVEDAVKAGQPPPMHCSDVAIADVIMDFLFASQDASTASLTWISALLADRPDVLAKVREEQQRVKPNLNTLLSGDELADMVYTRQVVKETLRYRPAAPMVPQLAAVDFPLKDGLVAPKGSLVIPSLMAPVWSGEGFPDADKFDPERMGPERKEDVKYAKHFLTFGCGPHACVGYQYAINHLIAYAARLSMQLDWQRQRTPKSDDLMYLPTIYPADCLLKVSARKPGSAAAAPA